MKTAMKFEFINPLTGATCSVEYSKQAVVVSPSSEQSSVEGLFDQVLSNSGVYTSCAEAEAQVLVDAFKGEVLRKDPADAESEEGVIY